MKKQIILLVASVILGITTSYSQETTETFPVKGTCEMCKRFIERAAKKVKGVSEANWSIEKKEIEVSFDSSKTTLEDIHASIAKAGYDTEMATRNERAYKRLPSCCHYDSKPPKPILKSDSH